MAYLFNSAIYFQLGAKARGNKEKEGLYNVQSMPFIYSTGTSKNLVAL